MGVISLTVVSINGKSIAPSIYGFETDDIVIPISNDGTYSTIVSRDVKGIDQQARSNAKYVYEVQEELTTISSLSTDIFLVDVTYRKGVSPQFAVNYQRIFTVKMVSGVFTPVTLGTQFYVGEDGDPNLVFYQVSQTVAQIAAQTTPAAGGSVTSVGLSMPSAFNVANTPITTAGVINVTGAGLDSQYIRGDGTLANFPTSIGGGASTSFYLNGGTNQGVFGGDTYYQMSPNAIVNVPVNFSINADGYVARFITDIGSPAQLNIPAGNWNFEMYFSASSSGGTPNFYVELYKYDTATTTFTLLASNSTNPEGITNGTVTDLYTTALAVPATVLTLTDRLAVRVHVHTSGRTITLHTQDGTLCQIITTFTTGLTALNGLTSQIQTFATGTSGTDFNINSAVSTHTFNLPIADATHTGKLSSTDWSDFNSKAPSTRTISTNAPLSGGGDLSADRTLSISQASGLSDGYLSSADWTTFNNKANNDYYVFSIFASPINPVDSTTYYFIRNTPNTIAANNAIKLGFSGVIEGAVLIANNNTVAGSSENTTIAFRNITTATSHTISNTFKTNATATIVRTQTITGLNIAFLGTDDICMQFTTPIYATNPQNLFLNAYLYIRKL